MDKNGILFIKVEKVHKTLLDLKNGDRAHILGFSGNLRANQKLTQYGIFEGDHLLVLRSAPFKGPVMLSINGREIALGRGIAASVLVEVEQ